MKINKFVCMAIDLQCCTLSQHHHICTIHLSTIIDDRLYTQVRSISFFFSSRVSHFFYFLPSQYARCSVCCWKLVSQETTFSLYFNSAETSNGLKSLSPSCVWIYLTKSLKSCANLAHKLEYWETLFFASRKKSEVLK